MAFLAGMTLDDDNFTLYEAIFEDGVELELANHFGRHCYYFASLLYIICLRVTLSKRIISEI